MKSHAIPENKCLDCGKLLDRAGGITIEGPSSGDATVCAYCGHIMCFTDNFGLRELTDKEVIQIAGDPKLLQMQAIVRKFQQLKKEKE